MTVPGRGTVMFVELVREDPTATASVWDSPDGTWSRPGFTAPMPIGAFG